MLTSSPYNLGGITVSKLMLEVLVALIPGIAVCARLLGPGVLIHCVLAVFTALICEAAAVRLRSKPVWPTLEDGSVLVLAVLLALTIAPLAPWWLTVTATGFAVLIVKHAFGGLGANVFNPAMAGYVFVLLCFPAEANRWPVTGGDVLGAGSAVIAPIFDSAAGADAVTGATSLDTIKGELRLMYMISEIRGDRVFGVFGAAQWEWINAAFLLGGLWLLWRGVIKWDLPAAMLAGLLLCAGAMYVVDSDAYLSPVFHLFSGATMIGAFFIVTDPVTSPTTPLGRLIFGFAVGVLIYVIRVSGIYPDGVAFAVLLMNALVPLLDRLTQPRVLGH